MRVSVPNATTAEADIDISAAAILGATRPDRSADDPAIVGGVV